MRFQIFENAWEVKKSKCENHFKWVPIILVCKMMRGFQIWPHNSNGIIFDPPFWPKKLSKSLENQKISRKISRFNSFWPKKGSNVIRFEFCGQIWTPLIILHIIGPLLTWFSHFDFLTSHAFSKNWNHMRSPKIVLIFEILKSASLPASKKT